MKKICAALFAFILIITLTSCSGGSGSKNDMSAKEKELAKTWLNDPEPMTYKTTTINEFTVGEEHYELYFPENMDDSLRLNVTSIPKSVNKADEELYSIYCGLTGFSSKEYDLFLSEFNKDTTKEFIKTNITKVTNAEPQKLLSEQIVLDETYLAATDKERVVATVYLPVKIMYVEYKKDDSRNISLYTYLLMPIYVSATYKNADATYADAVANSLSDKTITFTYKKGAIQ